MSETLKFEHEVRKYIRTELARRIARRMELSDGAALAATVYAHFKDVYQHLPERTIQDLAPYLDLISAAILRQTKFDIPL